MDAVHCCRDMLDLGPPSRQLGGLVALYETLQRNDQPGDLFFADFHGSADAVVRRPDDRAGVNQCPLAP